MIPWLTQLMTTMLMAYQSHVIVLVNTFGHKLLEHLIIVQMANSPLTIVHGGTALPPFAGTNYYCESGLKLIMVLELMLIISSVPHCGMDLAALLVTAVTTLLSQGFSKI